MIFCAVGGIEFLKHKNGKTLWSKYSLDCLSMALHLGLLIEATDFEFADNSCAYIPMLLYGVF